MIHYLDITKASKQDEGVIRCIARNVHGEKEVAARLRVNPKADFRSVLKNAKTGEPLLIQQTQPQEIDTERKNKINSLKYYCFYFIIFIEKFQSDC
jgi:hypothetical protein